MTMKPLLKQKVDELFLHWFSEVSTQSLLRKELQIIQLNSLSTSIKASSPINNSITGLNLNNRPSSPPIPPNSPTLTPRRSRSKLNSHISACPRKSLLKSFHDQTGFYPGCAKNLKQFFYPFGQPQLNESNALTLKKLNIAFDKFSNNEAYLRDFPTLTKLCGYPLYWKYALFSACGGKKDLPITRNKFIATWKKIQHSYHDDASRFYHMLAKNSELGLQKTDFEGLLQDIINTHPGLQFLQEAPEFHSRYITTVIARIFYILNRSYSGSITLVELRRSNFLLALKRIEEEEDINLVIDYFSYEHFYVIYCKFWELDTDHDMLINKQDLSKYSNGVISKKMINRLFDGGVTRNCIKDGKMTYEGFVWFILSEVDKNTQSGIEYWFRCMDLDGDGIISIYEMEHFYQDQLIKMSDMGIEALSFNDCLCQILDLVKPEKDSMITLRDIKKCKLASVFYNTFFNFNKWLEHEQKDPIQLSKIAGQSDSVWDQYVITEYELLVAEEGIAQNENDDEEERDEEERDDVFYQTNNSFDDYVGASFNLMAMVTNNRDSAF
ncbi:serine/threonine-protein phosphatase 2A regulatory subunit B'' subunit beta isoform X1 [Hydra vulgaris]|uniref:serine/threonine-protein phosphatase 2A regulatory subunit B'' subunit beta isoform X1 n=1 Tax=Hydra vulgaris TaxID=6087 RepID=UPI001F5F14F1|nr:serine/threonine-protein phosphatase 2A regulatory subunit B'' subunit beta [Hydra vulgaris]XP_047130519.1 serine/threonine-protein phosphatase 2A regulatory subunit B'' subunit beta [Hydra vulgaris]XP_047130520.1 serine/threonine-protein phosphatase 2A regulatory subunit B'' subunit beta [Hydra vulgaris]